MAPVLPAPHRDTDGTSHALVHSARWGHLPPYHHQHSKGAGQHTSQVG